MIYILDGHTRRSLVWAQVEVNKEAAENIIDRCCILCAEWCAYVCFDRTVRSRRSISTCINYFTSQQRAEIPIPKRVTWTWNCFSSPSPPRPLPSWFIVVNILVSLLCAVSWKDLIESSTTSHHAIDLQAWQKFRYFNLIRHQRSKFPKDFPAVFAAASIQGPQRSRPKSQTYSTDIWKPKNKFDVFTMSQVAHTRARTRKS